MGISLHSLVKYYNDLGCTNNIQDNPELYFSSFSEKEQIYLSLIPENTILLNGNITSVTIPYFKYFMYKSKSEIWINRNISRYYKNLWILKSKWFFKISRQITLLLSNYLTNDMIIIKYLNNDIFVWKSNMVFIYR